MAQFLTYREAIEKFGDSAIHSRYFGFTNFREIKDENGVVWKPVFSERLNIEGYKSCEQ